MKKRTAKRRRAKAKTPRLHARERKEKKPGKHKEHPQDYQAYLMWSYAT